MVDFSKIDNIEFGDLNHSDYPDFVDAFIAYCDIDGVPATEDELDEINQDSEFVWTNVMEHLN